MKKIIVCQVVVCLFIVGSAFGAKYWPTWRGPGMAGIYTEGNPPVTWSESENIKWKVKLVNDRSNSSPVIWKDRVIFQTAVETERSGEVAAPTEEDRSPQRKRRPGEQFGGKKPTNLYEFNVVCLDRKTGKTKWETTVSEAVPHEGHHDDHGYASFSPVTDGKLIWVNFGSRGVHCLDMNGNIKWSKAVDKMKTRNSFGESSSPAIAGDKLIVVMDHEGDSYIIALNKKTGDIAWKKPRDERTSWTTPVVVKVGGKLQVVVNGYKRIRSYDPKDGKVIWECGGQTDCVVTSPVAGLGMVYCASGFRGSALQAIKLGKTGDLTGTDAIVWQVDEATPYVPSPLLYDGKLYVCSVNKGIISVYDAKTGKPHYVKQALDEIKGIYASPVAAGGRVYFTGRKGVVYVIKASEKFEVLAVNKLDDSIDASPAFAGDEMYLKGKEYLYCIAGSK